MAPGLSQIHVVNSRLFISFSGVSYLHVMTATAQPHCLRHPQAKDHSCSGRSKTALRCTPEGGVLVQTNQ